MAFFGRARAHSDMPRVIQRAANDLAQRHAIPPIMDEWDAMRLVYEALRNFTDPEQRRILRSVCHRLDTETAEPAEADQET